MTEDAKLTVLFNGACPICSREIAAYQRRAEAEGLDIAFEDLNTADLDAWGVDREAARRRLHLREGGRVRSGLDAFVALWRVLPRLGWLARLVSLPGLRPVAGGVYEWVLAPLLYRFDRLRRGD